MRVGVSTAANVISKKFQNIFEISRLPEERCSISPAAYLPVEWQAPPHFSPLAQLAALGISGRSATAPLADIR